MQTANIGTSRVVRIPETMFHDSEIMCLELHMIPISVFHYTKKTALLQGEFVKKAHAFFLWVFGRGRRTVKRVPFPTSLFPRKSRRRSFAGSALRSQGQDRFPAWMGDPLVNLLENTGRGFLEIPAPLSVISTFAKPPSFFEGTRSSPPSCEI